jgi:peptidoglycan hydrolase-like protein with peptidoglycan-binding domain
MPGRDLLYSTNPESFDSTPVSIKPKAAVSTQTPNKPVTLSTYTPQTLDVKKHEMFGPRISRREQRKFTNYIFSPQGMQDAIAFGEAERLRAQAAYDYVASRNAPALKATMPSIASNEQKQAALNVINQPAKAPIPKPEVKVESKPVNTAYWNSQANKFGFSNMDEVKAWQQQNGLVADGMFGKNSEAKWRSMQQQATNPQLVSRTVTTVDGTPMDVIKKEGSAVEVAPSFSPGITEEQFRNHKNFRDIYGSQKNRTITIEGKEYPVMASTGLLGNTWGLENDAVYAFDPETGMIRQVRESALFGGPSTVGGYKFANGSSWSNALEGMAKEEAWLKANPAPAKRGPLGGTTTQEYNNWLNKYMTAKAGWKKQGGTMNRINYFQQGGAAPQQDIKAQVTALVQAAMQGDQKATQQVNQIMEAAKSGDQQAMQIAQIMEQVVKELQGQATSAKWGAKLGYIKSLKYAKGGKTCPACEKKVEMKACGGKKAKKHQEGGWMEMLPLYGTY